VLRRRSYALGVERGGEFDVDCHRPAVVPLTETVQAISEIFECSVLGQHERKYTVFESYRHPASALLVVMDV
jgi:hypothetical protein